MSGPGLLDSLSVLPFFPCCMFVVDSRYDARPHGWSLMMGLVEGDIIQEGKFCTQVRKMLVVIDAMIE